MIKVTARELFDKGEHVLDLVATGERVVVTRGGRPVAELRRLVQPVVSADELLARWRHVPCLDALPFRQDVGAALDDSL